jgi:hypothetical protein
VANPAGSAYMRAMAGAAGMAAIGQHR